MMRSSLLALALAVAGCASGPHPWSGHALCEATRDGAGEPGPDAWVRLLLRGFDPETRRATSPAVDCTGAQVRWDGPALACDDGATARTVLPDHAIGAEDVVVTTVDERTRLVWIVTNRFASGDGLGPAAVVELRDDRLVVRAAGPLRANVLRARLRLEPLGSTEALVAEGDHCASADPASCVRAVRVVPLAGERFVSVRVDDARGACASPAWFQVGREDSVRLPSGWRRRTRLDGSVAFAGPVLSISEQIVVEDVDPRQPTAPARLFRKADSRTDVRLEAGGLVASGTSLWSRIAEAGR